MQIQIEFLSNTDIASNLYSNIQDSAFYRKSIKIKPSIDKKMFEEVIGDG
jgi:hypothetical protein